MFEHGVSHLAATIADWSRGHDRERHADVRRVSQLAAAAADGLDVDWAEAEASAVGTHERGVIRQLGAVAWLLKAAGSQSVPEGAAAPPRSLPAQPSSWGPLSIQAELGRGRFGTVFRAVEPGLNREVALKLLHDVRPGAEDQVVAEARLLAQLSHRNVVTVYGADRFDGHVGFWTEYLKGRTLAEFLKRNGRLSAQEAIVIGLDVCRALAAVHRGGFLHCDVKPQNVMRADGGRIVLMDFGAARLASAGAKQSTAQLIGTPLYMAPEVLLGAPPSVRSDVYSTGVLLYHLVTGDYPVMGDSFDAMLAAHTAARRVLLRDRRPDLPAAFVGAVEAATAAAPEDRPETAGAMEALLERASGCTTVVRRRAGGPEPQRFEEEPSVAVLRFKDASPDRSLDYFCDGLADEIINALGRVSGLRVVTGRSAAAADADTDDPRHIGDELNAGAVLQGSVRASGDQVRVIARLVDATTGGQLWSERFDRDLSDIFGVQDETARAVVRELGVRVAKEPARGARPRSAEAYTRYLKARHCWNQRTEVALHKSVEYFQAALEQDPEYADAHAGLADAYTTLGLYGVVAPHDVMPRGRAAAERAIQIAGHLCGPHATIGCIAAVYDWAWHAAARHFHHAMELNAGDPAAHHWYAINYLVPLQRFDEASAELRRAIDADPLSMPIRASLGLRSYFAHDFERARRELRDSVELDPASAMAHLFLGLTLAEMGYYNDALAELQKGSDLAASPEMIAGRGYVFARAGHRERAHEALGELTAMSRARYVSPSLVAQIHAGAGDASSALDWLEQAASARAADLAWLSVRPVFDRLHSEPRFNALIARLGV